LKVKNRKPHHFKTYKQRGEWVELKFMMEAAARGFNVAKPHGESARYDASVEKRGNFRRVQIKSTSTRWTDNYANAYRCYTISNQRTRKRYSPKQIDFLAVYVIPADAWYIIPAEVLGRRTMLLLYPHRRKTQSNRYEQFREAWHLLDG